MIELYKKIEELEANNASYVIVTLTDIKGSAPQEVGAKMIITSNGLFWGTIGGGKIEAHCIRYAQKIIEDNLKSQLQSWNLQTDIGMSCGGEVSIFFDFQKNDSMTIAIFGAGHISQELCRVIQNWRAKIIIADPRQDWLDKIPKKFNIQTHCLEHPKEIVSLLPEKSFILCMTKGHAFDVPVLVEAFKEFKKYSMIGVIGSKVKATKIKRELIEAGIEKSDVENLHSPLGLPIGNNTPPEIAISIAAQVLQIRDQA